MFRTEFGIVTEINDVQALKAPGPISNTESGIETDINSEHFQKAQTPILVTEFGMETDFKSEHPQKAPSSISVIDLGIIIDVKPVSRKADLPIFINLSGSCIAVSLLQFLNAMPLISTTEFPKETDAKLVQ